jgi:propanediol utilization protein
VITDKRKKILIEASGSHIHLTQSAIEALFGKGEDLKKRRDLSQPGQFLSEQRIKLVTRAGVIDNVAVLGPAREAIQVELSMTDCVRLGIKAPINLSGDLSGASDVLLVGCCGELKATDSVIVAKNHIHMRPQDAQKYEVSDGQEVDVLVEGERQVIFKNVPIRIKESFSPVMHVDFDEANASGYRVGTQAFILYDKHDCSLMTKTSTNEQIVKDVRQAIISKQEMSEVKQEKKKEFESVIKTDICASKSPIIGMRLITEKQAKELVDKIDEKTLCFTKGTIITPSAKDVFRAVRKVIEFE